MSATLYSALDSKTDYTNNLKIQEENHKTDELLEVTFKERNVEISGGREKWNKQIEFLFSCIALSVGLGNIWRFPFIAHQNGGGAFLIPYVIVLLLIGRPIYYMEVIIGQFASRGCIKAFDMVPLMRGIAYGQIYATALATTYYACVMAITIRYLIASLSPILPWSYCHTEWGVNCLSISETTINNPYNISTMKGISSAELYFTKTILREKDNITDGIGLPNWDLVLCLLLAWIIIAIILIRGIRSSGKVSYFLAVFPYVILLILLIRAVTLPGAMAGIWYFLKPQWHQLLNPHVWYAAITQMFFSLAICFGTLIMYSSYNDFRKDVHLDVMIITTIDSFTSILAGCIIFGILGHLAYETHSSNGIADVVKGGAGLAYISYPEAISKFHYFPQLFAALFFFMLLVLGIGSNIGMASSVITVIKDHFTQIPQWVLSILTAIVGFLVGLIYTTPGGQFILNLIDFFGCSFIALFLAIAELISVGWIYGVKRFCQDIEFMLNTKTSWYWRICWAFIAPGLMILVLIYTLVYYQPLTYKGVKYPDAVYLTAWLIWAIGVAQVPFWAVIAIYQQTGKTFKEKFLQAMKPTSEWGPLDASINESYHLNRRKLNYIQKTNCNNCLLQLIDNAFG